MLDRAIALGAALRRARAPARWCWSPRWPTARPRRSSSAARCTPRSDEPPAGGRPRPRSTCWPPRPPATRRWCWPPAVMGTLFGAAAARLGRHPGPDAHPPDLVDADAALPAAAVPRQPVELDPTISSSRRRTRRSRGQQPVHVGVVDVGRQPDPQRARVAQPEPPRRLDRVERARPARSPRARPGTRTPRPGRGRRSRAAASACGARPASSRRSPGSSARPASMRARSPSS